MILITGTTGHLGRLVVDELLARGAEPGTIIASARTPERLDDLGARGVVVRRLDYSDPASIAAALDGVVQVLLVSSSEIGQRVDQHRAVIDAAAAAGVSHLAYTSLLRADTSSMIAAIEHRATEDLLAAAPLTTTRLRNGWYLENYTENLASALEHGALVGAAGDGRIAGAARADYAAAAATVLLDTSKRGGTYELGGPSFTLSDVAAALSSTVGREIGYVDVPGEQLAGILSGAGLPGPMVDFLVDADRGIAAGELDTDSTTLRELVGRELTSLAAAVAAAV